MRGVEVTAMWGIQFVTITGHAGITLFYRGQSDAQDTMDRVWDARVAMGKDAVHVPFTTVDDFGLCIDINLLNYSVFCADIETPYRTKAAVDPIHETLREKYDTTARAGFTKE